MSENTVEVVVDGQTLDITINSTNLLTGGGVTSWNGRTLAVVPIIDDYDTDLIENTSSVVDGTATYDTTHLSGVLEYLEALANGDTHNIVEVVDGYVITIIDDIVLVDGIASVELPLSTSATKEVTVKAMTDTVTLTLNSSETGDIDGNATATLTLNKSFTIAPYSGGWTII